MGIESMTLILNKHSGPPETPFRSSGASGGISETAEKVPQGSGRFKGSVGWATISTRYHPTQKHALLVLCGRTRAAKQHPMAIATDNFRSRLHLSFDASLQAARLE
jgi:hypothetical protein